MADETTTTSEAGTGNEAGTSSAPGGSPPLPNSQPATTPPAATPDDGKQFTQADLDKLAGRRAAEAKRAAQKEVADALGVSLDEAKQIIADRQAAAEAEKTEIQRAQDNVAKANRERDEALAAKAQTDRQSLIKEKLLLRGVGAQFDATDPEQLKRKQKVLEAAQAIVERFAPSDAAGEDLDAVIEENVALVPGFTHNLAPANGTERTAPSGVTNGAQPPPGGQPPKSAIERGRERARAARQAHPPTSAGDDPFAGIRTA